MVETCRSSDLRPAIFAEAVSGPPLHKRSRRAKCSVEDIDWPLPSLQVINCLKRKSNTWQETRQDEYYTILDLYMSGAYCYNVFYSYADIDGSGWRIVQV